MLSPHNIAKAECKDRPSRALVAVLELKRPAGCRLLEWDRCQWVLKLSLLADSSFLLMMCNSNIFKMRLCRANVQVFHKICHALQRPSTASGARRVKRADRAAMCQCHYARNDGDSTAACSRSRGWRSPSCCCGWSCAAYNADNNKCMKEINILFMFAPRCIRMHARPSAVCVYRECVFVWVRICKTVFMLQFPIKTRTRNSLPPEAYDAARSHSAPATKASVFFSSLLLCILDYRLQLLATP